MSQDSFQTRRTLDVGGRSLTYFSLPALGERFDIGRLPYSMKILLENLLRHEDGGVTVGPEHIEAVAKWDCKAEPDTEIAFMPARVVLQDFTGVPCVVDLAAMRDAVTKLGGNPRQINPLIPSELVIDHSVQVDVFGTPDALDLNGKIEFQRNMERYWCLRWLLQEGVKTTHAEVLRENVAKIGDLPLIGRVHGMPALDPGAMIEVELSDIDLLAIDFRAHYRGMQRG